MKLKLTFFLACAASAVSTYTFADTSSDEALNACKRHIAANHQDQEVRRNVKSIENWTGAPEVKVRVVTNSETYNAVCSFSYNGDMTYLTDRTTEVVTR